MAEIQLEKTDIHKDVYRVKSPSTTDARKRANVASSLRARAKRENGMTVATRGESVYVVTSAEGKKALPKVAGRGAPGKALSELVASAS